MSEHYRKLLLLLWADHVSLKRPERFHYSLFTSWGGRLSGKSVYQIHPLKMPEVRLPSVTGHSSVLSHKTGTQPWIISLPLDMCVWGSVLSPDLLEWPMLPEQWRFSISHSLTHLSCCFSLSQISWSSCHLSIKNYSISLVWIQILVPWISCYES